MKVVSITSVPGTYRRSTVYSPAGRIDQWPPSGSRMRAKIASESYRGRQSQSIDPSRLTRAAELQSASNPCSPIGVKAPRSAAGAAAGWVAAELMPCSRPTGAGVTCPEARQIHRPVWHPLKAPDGPRAEHDRPEIDGMPVSARRRTRAPLPRTCRARLAAGPGVDLSGLARDQAHVRDVAEEGMRGHVATRFGLEGVGDLPAGDAERDGRVGAGGGYSPCRPGSSTWT